MREAARSLTGLGDVVRSVWSDFGEIPRNTAKALGALGERPAAGMLAAVSGLLGGGRMLAGLMTGAADAAAWCELEGKWRTYWRVRQGEGRPRQAGAPLLARVEEACALPPSSVLFELEGLGHDYADDCCRDGGDPLGLLSVERTGDLPEGSLLPLHAGMGMAFAQRALAELQAWNAEAEIGAALDRFVRLCRDNARAGYAEVALEPLGLIVRTFLPRRTRAAGDRLRAFDRDLAGCFWHGVGRAVYFLPRRFIPSLGVIGQAAAACLEEAPDAESRRDALSGLFYAAAMVSLERPAVLERLLLHAGESPAAAAAFTSGVSACLVARHHTLPGDPAVAGLLQHRPDPARPWLAELWQRQVKRPGEEALRLYPALRARGRLGALARCRLPAELARLAGEEQE